MTFTFGSHADFAENPSMTEAQSTLDTRCKQCQRNLLPAVWIGPGRSLRLDFFLLSGVVLFPCLPFSLDVQREMNPQICCADRHSGIPTSRAYFTWNSPGGCRVTVVIHSVMPTLLPTQLHPCMPFLNWNLPPDAQWQLVSLKHLVCCVPPCTKIRWNWQF